MCHYIQYLVVTACRFMFEALPRVVRMHLPDNTQVLKGGGSSSAIQHDRRKPGLLSKMLNVTKYRRQRVKQQVSSVEVRKVHKYV